MADALKVSKAAVAAWLPELTGWLRLKKVSHPGLDTPNARNKTVHRFGESAQSNALARKRPQRKKKEQRAARALAKKEEEEKKTEALICFEHII